MRQQDSPKRKAKYDEPLRQVDRRQAAKATAKDNMVAGQFVRRQFLFTPSQLDMIVRVAEELNLSQNAAARWLVDVGLEAYTNGERPDIEVVEVRAQPRLKDWS
jgi:hypothetical protein